MPRQRDLKFVWIFCHQFPLRLLTADTKWEPFRSFITLRMTSTYMHVRWNSWWNWTEWKREKSLEQHQRIFWFMIHRIKATEGPAFLPNVALGSLRWYMKVPDMSSIWGKSVELLNSKLKNLKFWYKFRIRKFESKFVCVVCFLLGNSPASEFYIPTFRNALSVPSS